MSLPKGISCCWRMTNCFLRNPAPLATFRSISIWAVCYVWNQIRWPFYKRFEPHSTPQHSYPQLGDGEGEGDPQGSAERTALKIALEPGLASAIYRSVLRNRPEWSSKSVGDWIAGFRVRVRVRVQANVEWKLSCTGKKQMRYVERSFWP